MEEGEGYTKKKTKVFLISSGLGHIKRGFEQHIQQCFEELKPVLGDQLKLLKGGGKNSVPTFRQHSKWATWIGKLVNKHPYEVQNYSFFLGSLYWILRDQPTTLYLGEPMLYRLYTKLRKQFNLQFRLVFFSGGGVIPKVTYPQDRIQFVVPPDLIQVDVAKLAAKHCVLPHTLNAKFTKTVAIKEVQRLRESLNIPMNCSIILSVGALDRQKRMDYVIREVAKISQACFLILLGQEEADTPKIRALADKLLPNACLMKTVSREELPLYYSLADVFVLASLKEGFGLVYLEALNFGLPVLAHNFPVARYVLKDLGCFGDFTKENELQALLAGILEKQVDYADDEAYKNTCRAFIRKEYSSEAHQDAFLALLRD